MVNINLADIKSYQHKNNKQVVKATKLLDEEKMIIFVGDTFNSFYTMSCDEFKQLYNEQKNILKD